MGFEHIKNSIKNARKSKKRSSQNPLFRLKNNIKNLNMKFFRGTQPFNPVIR